MRVVLNCLLSWTVGKQWCRQDMQSELYVFWCFHYFFCKAHFVFIEALVSHELDKYQQKTWILFCPWKVFLWCLQQEVSSKLAPFLFQVVMDSIIRLSFSFRRIHRHLNSSSNLFPLWYENVIQKWQKNEALEPLARKVCLALYSNVRWKGWNLDNCNRSQQASMGWSKNTANRIN